MLDFRFTLVDCPILLQLSAPSVESQTTIGLGTNVTKSTKTVFYILSSLMVNLCGKVSMILSVPILRAFIYSTHLWPFAMGCRLFLVACQNKYTVQRKTFVTNCPSSIAFHLRSDMAPLSLDCRRLGRLFPPGVAVVLVLHGEMYLLWCETVLLSGNRIEAVQMSVIFRPGKNASSSSDSTLGRCTHTSVAAPKSPSLADDLQCRDLVWQISSHYIFPDVRWFANGMLYS